VAGGSLRVESPNALGSTAAGTEVWLGATLQIQGGVTVTGEALTIAGEGVNGTNGALRNISGTNTWASTVVVASNVITRISSDTNLLAIGGLLLSNAPTDQLMLQGAGNITVSGPISGPSALVSGSLGAGVRTLAGVNTYTGPTWINGGTLSVLGSLASPAVTNSAGILQGTGTLAGALTIGTNGILSPGVSSALGEVLTVNNAVVLTGTSVFEIGKTGSVPANDQVAGVTDITYGGTLIVTNVSGTPLSGGDEFTLFVASGTKSGSITNIVLQPADASVSLSFNPSTGKLIVTSLAPPSLSYVGTGTGIQFSWTEAGYRLQAQTNGINIGLSTNWFDYPGGATSPVTVPYDAAQGSVFFRLTK
jgi:autotransporter-associated beta strand protein